MFKQKLHRQLTANKLHLPVVHVYNAILRLVIFVRVIEAVAVHQLVLTDHGELRSSPSLPRG